MERKIYLYWSKKDPFSKKIIRLIRRYDTNRIIKCMSIENLIDKNKQIPSVIEMIPSMVVITNNRIVVVGPNDIVEFIGTYFSINTKRTPSHDNINANVLNNIYRTNLESTVQKKVKNMRMQNYDNNQEINKILNVIHRGGGYYEKIVPIDNKCVPISANPKDITRLIPRGSDGMPVVNGAKENGPSIKVKK